jgi:hypothetical protein
MKTSYLNALDEHLLSKLTAVDQEERWKNLSGLALPELYQSIRLQ